MQEKRAAQFLGEPFFFILEAGNLLIDIHLDIISVTIWSGISGIKLMIWMSLRESFQTYWLRILAG
jgi:hypothetical protein